MGPASFIIDNVSTSKTTVNNLSTGIYQFELKVTDAGGVFDKDTLQITVNAQSIPPCDNSNRPVINAQLLPVGTLSQATGIAAALAGSAHSLIRRKNLLLV